MSMSAFTVLRTDDSMKSFSYYVHSIAVTYWFLGWNFQWSNWNHYIYVNLFFEMICCYHRSSRFHEPFDLHLHANNIHNVICDNSKQHTGKKIDNFQHNYQAYQHLRYFLVDLTLQHHSLDIQCHPKHKLDLLHMHWRKNGAQLLPKWMQKYSNSLITCWRQGR